MPIEIGVKRYEASNKAHLDRDRDHAARIRRALPRKLQEVTTMTNYPNYRIGMMMMSLKTCNTIPLHNYVEPFQFSSHEAMFARRIHGLGRRTKYIA